MKKEFFKPMNNSIYGKTCENHAKHTDIRLRKNTEELKMLSCKPQCQGFRIFDEHLLGRNLNKVLISINKPFYGAFALPLFGKS